MSSEPSTNPVTAQTSFRPEIQGLRAIAVVAVMAFHMWPKGPLAGGYVGVDVFFVISGFLITGILLREFEATGTISITRFYSRRIRRLLPAATLTLLAVAACIALFPASRWGDIQQDIMASALYFQNWNLAARAVDYLAAGGPQSPLEHFWSLSVEEQYYFIWPLLALASIHVTRRAARHPKAAFASFIGLIGIGSLVWSIHLTPRQPGLAYFATTTRAWELALGGALAVYRGWEKWPKVLRASLGPAGLALIVLACLHYNQATSFPGYHALAPTVGAAMVIVCGGCGGRLATQRLLAIKPIQYLGDISYSLYLWHWPVISVYLQEAGGRTNVLGVIGIVSISLLLAHLSKVYVEDRFRANPANRTAKQAWKPFGLAVICLAASLLAPVSARLVLTKPPTPPAPETLGTRATMHAYPGARALTANLTVPADAGPYLPRPVQAKDDHPPRSCHTGLTGTKITTCQYGNPTTSLAHVVLLGDSHADQWLPAFRILATRRNWQLTAMTKSACAFAVVTEDQFTTKANRSCALWNRAVLARLLQARPDAVFIGQSLYSLMHIEDLPNQQARKLLVHAMTQAWHQLIDAGITVYVIKDTPKPGRNVPDCLSAPNSTIRGCSALRAEALSHPDPVILAARALPKARLINLDDAICGHSTCRAVVGNILVYRDTHHLTRAYVRSLTPTLAARPGIDQGTTD